MRYIDTLELYKLAETEGIAIESWSFPTPLDAIYFREPGMPPIIGLSNTLFTDTAIYRCILAEEIGHHITTVGPCITHKNMTYRERLKVSKTEYQAVKWAAEFLIPFRLLKRAIVWECHWTNYMLAEYFDVTVEMLQFRLQLPDVEELINYTQAKTYG